MPPPSYGPPPPADPYGGGGGYMPQEPPPPAYATPVAPYGAAPAGAMRQNNTLSLVSMIVGIASLVICCVGVPGGVAALIMGIIGRNQINQSGGVQSGSGMALTGIICGAAAIGVSILGWILYVAGVLSSLNNG